MEYDGNGQFVWQESEGRIVTDNLDETDYVDYNNTNNEPDSNADNEVDNEVDNESDNDSNNESYSREGSDIVYNYVSDSSNPSFGNPYDNYEESDRDSYRGEMDTDDYNESSDNEDIDTLNTLRINHECGITDCRIPSVSIAIELCCAQDSYIFPSIFATEVLTEPVIKILDGYVGLIMSNCTLTSLTPLRLYTQLLLPGDNQVKTLVSVHSNTRKTYTIPKGKSLAKVVMLKITENRIIRLRDRITVTTDDTETVIETDCAVAVNGGYGGYVGIFISTELMLRKTHLRVSTSIINGDQYYPQICVRASIDSQNQ